MKPDIVSTITIPCQDDPNYLHTCLHGLIRHSHYKHRIIILWDDFWQEHHAFWRTHKRTRDLKGSRDFAIRLDGPEPAIWQPYKSMPEFFASHREWFAEHKIETVNVTAQYQELHDRYLRGKVLDENGVPYDVSVRHENDAVQGGVNTAFKDNFGLSLTATEWTIPNWDTDFYPCKDWDKPIFDYALSLPKDRREVLIPMHVQPQRMDGDPATFDAWSPESRAFAQTHMAIPTRKATAHGQIWVYEHEWLAYAEHNKRPGKQIRERPGDRKQLHWVPWVLRTQAIRDIGGFSLRGSGYDIEFDDRLRDKGDFMKVGFADSFCLHKGWIPVEDGVCKAERERHPRSAR